MILDIIMKLTKFISHYSELYAILYEFRKMGGRLKKKDFGSPGILGRVTRERTELPRDTQDLLSGHPGVAASSSAAIPTTVLGGIFILRGF